MAVTEYRIAFAGAHQVMRGVLAFPDNAGEGERLPGVLVHPEAGGMNEGILTFSLQLAGEGGFVCLTIDPYSHTPEDDIPYGAGFEALAPLYKQIDERSHLISLDNALSYLAELPIVDGDSIGVTGFCSGYPIVFSCHNARVKACLSFYNQIYYDDFVNADTSVHPIDRVANLWCPWQGHYGEEDEAVLVSAAREFVEKASAYNKSVELHTYEQCGHGFFDLSGQGEHPRSKAQAWERGLEFLQRHLRGKE